MGPALVTLLMGVILGYLAQRSRMCFIGGLRDFILVRDKELLKGVAAFFVTAWLAFSVAGYFGLLDLQAPEYQGSDAAVQEVAIHRSIETAVNVAQVSHINTANDSVSEEPAVRLASSVFQLGWPILILTVSAGVVIGLFSTLANGCPTRQHVLASQGMKDSMFYLAGFYLGVIVYYVVTKPLLAFII
jgi:uncharacterized membrane protein YedE/YeeE